MELNAYLTFDGNCAQALEFYAEVFGGTVDFVQLVADSPMAEDMPPEAQDKVLHGRVRVGDRLIMASDALGRPYEAPRGISMQTAYDDVDKASRVFGRLARNGTVEMPFGPTFWAAGFGACHDRYGIPWMVNCDATPPES